MIPFDETYDFCCNSVSCVQGPLVGFYIVVFDVVFPLFLGAYIEQTPQSSLINVHFLVFHFFQHLNPLFSFSCAPLVFLLQS